MSVLIDDKPKHHYYLIAGIILFSSTADQGENIGSAPANAIVRHDSTVFPAHKLAKAQQNLHKAFVSKMPEEARALLSIHDIVLTSVSYLGEMTEEEFQYQPTAEDIAPAPAPAPEVV